MILVCKWLRYEGMALWPFILLRNRELRGNACLLNHERVHLRQQAEMLVLPFYLFYLLHYFFNLLRCKKHFTAYRNIVFEREAYAHQQDPGYLRRRPFWAWVNYFTKT